MMRHVPAFPQGGFTRDAFLFLHRGGWAGVDLFFVLSGYLIAGLLFKEHQKYGTLSFKRFFIRRGFKIYPAYYVMALLTFALFLLIPGEKAPFPKMMAWTLPWLVYLQDYIYTPIGFLWGHAWSLAVEEQFYLFLPALFIVLLKVSKGPRAFSSIPALFAAIAAACLVFRLVNGTLPYDEFLHVWPFHVRLDSLFCGVFVSYLEHYHAAETERFCARSRYALLAAGIVLFSLPFFCTLENSPYVYTIGFTQLYLGSALILAAVAKAPPSSHPAVKALASIGTRSYSIYLWHYPVAVFLAPLHQIMSWTVLVPLYFSVTAACGLAACAAVEFPLLRLRDRLYPSRA